MCVCARVRVRVCVCTCMRCMESGSVQALLSRYVCSMYSEILCRKLRGSLKAIGMVILDSSYGNNKASTSLPTLNLPCLDSPTKTREFSNPANIKRCCR